MKPLTPADLAPPLRAILAAELAAGNYIREVSAWPPQCDLLVLLHRPFGQHYSLEPGLTFAAPNDPHYWQAEYRADGNRQMLAAGFG